MKNIKAVAAAVITAGILLGGCSSEPQSTKECIDQAQTMDKGLDCIDKDIQQKVENAPNPADKVNEQMTSPAPVETKTEAPVAPKKTNVDWSAGAPEDWQDQVDVFGINNDCKSMENAIISLPQKDADIQSMIVQQSKIFGCRK